MSVTKVAAGILVGAAAGALLGVLFAPAKGTVTRRRWSKRGEDVTESLKDEFEEFVDNFNERLEKLKKDSAELLDNGRHKADKVHNGLKKTATE